MAAVENLCNRCLYLERGTLVRYGLTRPVIAEYLAAQQVRADANLAERTDRSGSGEVRTTAVIIRNAAGEPVSTLRMGEPFTVDVHYEGRLKNAVVGVIISNGWIEQLLRAYSYESYPYEIELGRGHFRCTFKRNNLMAGEYSLAIWLGQVGRAVDYLTDCARLSIEPTDVYGTGKSPNPNGGLLFSEHSWDFTP
jgi:lipopolysaccharide transport system ATP-binding protein